MNGRAAKRIHRAAVRMVASGIVQTLARRSELRAAKNQLKREYYAKPYHQRVIMEGIVPSRTHKQQRQFDLNHR